MITEDYVSFETSKLLKEKGFIGDVQRWYVIGAPEEGVVTIGFGNETDYAPAPTIQMAMKWLREVHNIHIEIGYNMGYFPVCISTQTNETIPYIAMGNPFTYEKACEVAIKYCLENLI